MSIRKLLFYGTAGLAFGLSFGLAPLYIAHYYLFFGLTKAGYGFLSTDWLASTTDPFPIFSTMVEWTSKFAHPFLFYVYAFLLLALYAISLLLIVKELFQKQIVSSTSPWLLAAIVVLLHSVLLSDLTYGWSPVFFRGIANYYIPGDTFQPSLFGVFLFFSLALFLQKKIWSALTTAAIAAILQPSYLLMSGCLVASFLLISRKEGTPWKTIIQMACIFLLLITPVVLWTQLVLMKPTAPEIMAEAQRILVHERIPHHAVPSRWIWMSLLRIPYLLCALWLLRKTRLLIPLSFLFCAAILLSTIQMITGNDALALIAPWRAFALLVPVATLTFIAWSLSFIPSLRRYSESLALAILTLCAIYGIQSMRFDHSILSYPPFQELRTFIVTNASSDQLYLVPPRKKDFDHFHLTMGVPLYVNFKLHPFRDRDIVRWYERVRKADELYASPESACQSLQNFPQENITHIVTTADLPLDLADCPKTTEIFRNIRYAIYAIN